MTSCEIQYNLLGLPDVHGLHACTDVQARDCSRWSRSGKWHTGNKNVFWQRLKKLLERWSYVINVADDVGCKNKQFEDDKFHIISHTVETLIGTHWHVYSQQSLFPFLLMTGQLELKVCLVVVQFSQWECFNVDSQPIKTKENRTTVASNLQENFKPDFVRIWTLSVENERSCPRHDA